MIFEDKIECMNAMLPKMKSRSKRNKLVGWFLQVTAIATIATFWIPGATVVGFAIGATVCLISGTTFNVLL